MKILFLNNYNMEHAFQDWKEGLFPGHHLWGLTHLNDFGMNIEILPFEPFSKVYNHWRMQKLLKLLGLNQSSRRLDQQLSVLLRNRYDVVYSGCQNHTLLLAKLRTLRLFNKPIVAIIHHPIPKGHLSEYYFNGHDRLICLSEKVRESLLADYNLEPEKVIKLDWGVDLKFYGEYCKASTNGDGQPPVIISAGKSNRDHDVLVNSVVDLDCEVHIYCSEDTRPTIAPLPRNISVTNGPKETNAISYTELVRIYKNAYAIAIPLNKTDVLAGLTSLLDALAIGRPVIMTRNPYVDIDIEALGIGIWVDHGDVLGWKSAILELLDDPVMAQEMGARARQLSENGFNIHQFSENLARVFKGLSY